MAAATQIQFYQLMIQVMQKCFPFPNGIIKKLSWRGAEFEHHKNNCPPII